MPKLESFLGNEAHEIFWEFDLKTNHRIPVWQRDIMLINKKKIICHVVDFAVPTDFTEKIWFGFFCLIGYQPSRVI